MASKKNGAQKGNGDKKNSHGQKNADRRGSVGDSIEKTEGGRAAKRGHRQNLNFRRNTEREEGTFYTRTNGERSDDLRAALSGQSGDYAYPGGDLPSVHFNVQNEIGRRGTMPVIRFETIQYGHELEGAAFDPRVFLPCFYVERHGTDFRSRNEDKLMAATQELICHYLAKQPLNVPVFETVTEAAEEPQTIVEAPRTIEDSFREVKTGKKGMRALLDGIPGFYGRKTASGTIILGVFMTKQPNVEVLESSIEGIEPGRYFLPVHLLQQESLQQVTGDEIYSHQVKLFQFLRAELGNMINKPKMEQAQPAPAAKPLPKLLTDAERELAYANMRKHAISMIRAAQGDLGHVVFGSGDTELIIKFAAIGADKQISIERLGTKHPLRQSGVNMETTVFAGQVMKGGIDNIDALHMNPALKNTKDALISFLVKAMEEAGIKLAKPKSHLRLVEKKAA